MDAETTVRDATTCRPGSVGDLEPVRTASRFGIVDRVACRAADYHGVLGRRHRAR